MIDINKTYRTRDGREVRIYATDGGGRNPIHGSIKDEDGWIFQVWPKSGRYINEDEDYRIDLIEVRPRHKRTVWLNVYGNVCALISGEGVVHGEYGIVEHVPDDEPPVVGHRQQDVGLRGVGLQHIHLVLPHKKNQL